MKIVFSISPGSTRGVTFAGAAPDAMWIVDKAALASPTGAPAGPYRGNEFRNFVISAGGKRLSVLDANDDARVYQYALAFTVPTVIGEIQPPSVSGDKRSVTFLDEESEEDAYQYAVALDGPAGRVVLDPEIKNGGKN